MEVGGEGEDSSTVPTYYIGSIFVPFLLSGGADN